MTFLSGVIVGGVLGVLLGVFVMTLVAVAKDDEEAELLRIAVLMRDEGEAAVAEAERILRGEG